MADATGESRTSRRAGELEFLRRQEKWRSQAICQYARERQEFNQQLKGEAHRALVLADVHIPYHNTRVIDWAVSLAKKAKCDGCILAGDTLTFDAFSRFLRTQFIPGQREIEIGEGLLSYLSDNFDWILFIVANHEERFKKYLYRSLEPNAVKTIDHMGTSDVGAFFSKSFPKVMIAHEWAHMGEVYVSHKEEFSSIPMRSVCNVDDYFRLHHEGPAPRVIFHAHTHHQGKMPRRGCLLLETGCACNYMTYALSGRTGPSRTELWYQGCGIAAINKEGKAILPDCDVHYYGICQKT